MFQAEDAKTGQTVALKVFSPQFPQGNQELQRFANVMKGILPLRHPNLVALYGAGKTTTYTWIAREFVEGESLKLRPSGGRPRKRSRRGTLPEWPHPDRPRPSTSLARTIYVTARSPRQAS